LAYLESAPYLLSAHSLYVVFRHLTTAADFQSDSFVAE